MSFTLVFPSLVDAQSQRSASEFELMDNFREVADHFRASGNSLPVERVLILSDQGDFHGRGKIWCDGTRIHLEVMWVGAQELAPLQGGPIRRDQFWPIGGVINDRVPFWGLSRPTVVGTKSGRRYADFRFDRVHSSQIPFSGGRFKGALKKAVRAEKRLVGSALIQYVEARLIDHKVLWKNTWTETTEKNDFLGTATRGSRDTFVGSTGTIEYALVQKGADCEFHARAPKGKGGPSTFALTALTALQKSIAYTHGQNFWPQWQRITLKDGQVFEYATAPRTDPSTIHILLSETAIANGADLAALTKNLSGCFLRKDDYSKAFERYLLLLREATYSKAPTNVLGVCAIFEGFVSLLYEHTQVPTGATSELEFKEARKRLIRYVQDKRRGATPEMSRAWERLLGLLGGASKVRLDRKLKEVAAHYSLPLSGLQPALVAWQAYRHALAHGSAPKGDLMDQHLAAGRIAGVINVLAGSAVGYSGMAVLSRLDDRYIRIPAH